MPRGMSHCDYCGAQIPNFYKNYHHKICLKRRLLAGKITKEEYLKRKGLLKMPKPSGNTPGDPNQHTLWVWQHEDNLYA